jgi:glycosidase
MIYYGDEVGLPGYGDPDNRQALWWNGVDTQNTTVNAVADSIAEGPSRVLRAVAALSLARSNHPALRTPNQIEWWDGGPGLYATAHRTDNDQAIVVINRTADEQWLDNGLAFAALDAQSWRNVLTEEVITADGDRLLFSIPPYSSQVWVPSE